METPGRLSPVIQAPIRHGLFLVIAVCAAITVLTEACRALGASFAAYSLLAVALTALVPVVSCYWLRRWPVPCERKSTMAAVLLLAIVCGTLAATTLRYDYDDYHYVPNAIYYLQHPQAAMGYDIFFLHAPDGRFQSFLYSGPFEYYPAALAHRLGLRYLDLYYVFRPALLGFLLPFVLYFTLATLSTETRIAPYALIVAVGCLLLLGETHRTPLNMSITRFCQGKTVLLTLGVPLFIAESFAFLHARRRGSWVFLCLLSVALCGASISTVLLLPPLAVAIGVAYLLAGPSRQALARLGVYLASLGYLAVEVLAALEDAAVPRSGDPSNDGWPRDLSGHLAFFVNRQWPITPVLLLAAVITALLLLPRRLSRFLLGFCAALLVTVFNPWLAPTLIRVSNSPSVYWRMFYLLPVGMFVGLAANEVHARCRSRRSRTLLAGGTAALLIAGFIVIPFNITRIPAVWSADLGGKPRDALSAMWKIKRQDLDRGREVLAAAPPGVMLAPADVANVISLLDSRYPQMRVREDPVRSFFSLRHELAYGEQRLRASDFVGGTAGAAAGFDAVLRRECGALRSIVMVEEVYANPQVQASVRACGLTKRTEAGRYTVVSRPGTR